MLVPFDSPTKACEAVSAVFRAGITPSAMEFMERDAIAWTMQFTEGLPTQVNTVPGAYLLVEVDGDHADASRQPRLVGHRPLLPLLAAVGGAVDAVAGIGVGRQVRFARAAIEHGRIRRIAHDVG